jgi:release factor glutamine methyltransferase
MDIRHELDDAVRILKNNKIESPAAEAGILLCHAIGKDKVFLFSHDDYVLKDNERNLFRRLVERRAEGEPAQYLTGQQEFMSLPFKVGPGVLIPRPETEILVEAAMDIARSLTVKKQRTAILDIGTGSGCIALSLAHYLPDARVIGTDISQDALNIARYNCQAMGLESKASFVRSNLFKELKTSLSDIVSFDIIVSNPPYIPSGHISALQKEVRCYEPASALDGGVDGLLYYRDIIVGAPEFLAEKGALCFEVGIAQASDVSGLMAEAGFQNISVKRDLSGIERVVTGYLYK